MPDDLEKILEKLRAEGMRSAPLPPPRPEARPPESEIKRKANLLRRPRGRIKITPKNLND